jgi:hypothetical protein
MEKSPTYTRPYGHGSCSLFRGWKRSGGGACARNLTIQDGMNWEFKSALTKRYDGKIAVARLPGL